MLYIVSKSYEPNSAISNRMLGFARGCSELGIDACFVFFIPNKTKAKVSQDFSHISFKYYWSNFLLPGRNLKYISYFLYVLMFFLKLRKSDKVVFLSCYDILNYFINIPYVDFYAEVTECPEIYVDMSRLSLLGRNNFYKTLQKLKGLFVISPSLKNFFVAKGVSEHKITVINMIVDLLRYKNIKKEPSIPYLAYCGIVSFYKDGVNDLLKSFGIVHKRYPDIKLTIIGRYADDATEKECYDIVQQMGIADSVIFKGSVSSEEMPQLLLNAEILLLARPNNTQSKYGFPTKLGEYLMTGNPVVLTDVGDMSLYLDNNISAIFAEPDNYDDFANKILWTLDNRDIASKIGCRGKAVAESVFNYRKETQKMLSIIFNDFNEK